MRRLIAIITTTILLVAVFVFNIFFENKRFDIAVAVIVLISLIPFFVNFEAKVHPAREVVVLAIIVSLAIASRIIFAPLPGFKPVAALVIITGLIYGIEVGVITGILTALVSNFYFGQGPWTIYQMFAWGFIGLASGLFKNTKLSKSIVFACIWGFLCGFIYSLIMDIETVLFIDKNVFQWTRYFAVIISSLPVTVVYAVSNTIFILVLFKPIRKTLKRMQEKYGIYSPKVI